MYAYRQARVKNAKEETVSLDFLSKRQDSFNFREGKNYILGSYRNMIFETFNYPRSCMHMDKRE